MHKAVQVFHDLLADVFSIITYQTVLDRSVDTPGHGKYVVDGFNAVQKQYLATYLIMRGTPKVDKIESKRMRVDAMNNKVKVISAEECQRLLDF